jgi:hypothetical protein
LVFFFSFFHLFFYNISSPSFLFICFFFLLASAFVSQIKIKQKKEGEGQRHSWCEVHNLLMVQQA